MLAEMCFAHNYKLLKVQIILTDLDANKMPVNK
jgi:hypothetical protein